MEQGQKIIYDYFNEAAKKRDKWKQRNRFYQRAIERQFQFLLILCKNRCYLESR